MIDPVGNLLMVAKQVLDFLVDPAQFESQEVQAQSYRANLIADLIEAIELVKGEDDE